ncbi:MAG TPA: hypothetical protein VF457_18240, partial [Burkholderiaceae bacterium]
MRRDPRLLLFALALAGGVVALCAVLAPGRAPERPPVTVHATRRDIERRIEATGTLRPTAVVHVGALVSGVIA